MCDIEQLRQAIASRQVVCIVGAGVSISASNRHPLASWIGLLKDGLERCKPLISPDVYAADAATLNSGQPQAEQLLAIAGRIKVDLRAKGVLDEWLKTSLRSLTPIHPRIPECLLAMGIPLITTNYDTILEQCGDKRAISWHNEEELIRFAQGDPSYIFHLHGHWQDPNSIVLDERSYDSLARSRLAMAVLRAFPTVRSLMFVGCGAGLEDPTWSALRQWTREVFAHASPMHIRLVSEKETSELRTLHHPDEGIQLVSYGSHDDLPGFLDDLLPPGSKVVDRLPPLASGVIARDLVEEQFNLFLKGGEDILNIGGISGTGKTTLLPRLLRQAEQLGHRTIWVNGYKRFNTALQVAADASGVSTDELRWDYEVAVSERRPLVSAVEPLRIADQAVRQHIEIAIKRRAEVVLFLDDADRMPASRAWLESLVDGQPRRSRPKVVFLVQDKTAAPAGCTCQLHLLSQEEQERIVKQAACQSPQCPRRKSEHSPVSACGGCEHWSELIRSLRALGRIGLHPGILTELVRRDGCEAIRELDGLPQDKVISIFVERLLRRRNIRDRAIDRATLLRASVARHLSLETLRGFLAPAIGPQEMAEIGTLPFVKTAGGTFIFDPVAREVFLWELRHIFGREELRRIHALFAQHYSERRDTDRLEFLFHKLYIAPREKLASIALTELVAALPIPHVSLDRWIETVDQVINERRAFGGENVAAQLACIRHLLQETIKGLGRVVEGQALDVVYAVMLQSQRPEIESADATDWVHYLTARMRLAVGGEEDVGTEIGFLRQICNSRDVSSQLLRFCAAADLCETYTKKGELKTAEEWNIEAEKLADTPQQRALVLYQKSTNQKRLGRFSEAVKTSKEATGLLDGGPRSHYLRYRILLDRGNTYTYLCDWKSAAEAMDVAIGLWVTPDRREFAELSHRRGWLARMQGALDVALEHHDKAINVFNDLLTAPGMAAANRPSLLFLRAKAQHSRGNVHLERGDLELALKDFDDALAQFRRGHTRHAALVRSDMARAYLLAQKEGDAERAIDEGIRSFSRMGSDVADFVHWAEALVTKARIQIHQGRPDEALATLDQAAWKVTQVRGDGGNSPVFSDIRLARGFALYRWGKPDEARRLLKDENEAALLHGHRPPWLCLRSLLEAAPPDDRQSDRWPKRLEHERSWFASCAPVRNPPSPQTAEQVDYYDSSGRLLGTASKIDVHRYGLWHKSFHCWIAYLKDHEPRVIMQRRGGNVTDYPNMLDISAAGHYQTTEMELTGGLRELREELSLTLQLHELQRLARRTVNEPASEHRHNREWQDICLHIPEDGAGIQDRLSASATEVADVWELPVQGIIELLAGRASDVLALKCGSGSSGAVRRFVKSDFIPTAVDYVATIMAELHRRLIHGPHPIDASKVSRGVPVDGSRREGADDRAS